MTEITVFLCVFTTEQHRKDFELSQKEERQPHNGMLDMPHRRQYSFFVYDNPQSTLFYFIKHDGIKRIGQGGQSGAARLRKDRTMTPRCHAVIWRPNSDHQNTPTKVSHERRTVITLSRTSSSTILLVKEVDQTINQPCKRLFRSNRFGRWLLLPHPFVVPVGLSRCFQPHHPVRTSKIR